MAVANTPATLNGLFKEVYAKKLENLVPDGVKLLKEIPFATNNERTGKTYNQPVILGHEHGVTFASSSEDAVALNPAVAGQIENAQVQGNMLVLRSVMGYKSASASIGSPQAFEQATKFLVGNMLRSVTKKLEIEMLYGQVGYGVVAAAGPTGAVIPISAAEWAPGIWAGAEKMPIEVRNAAGGTSRGTANITAVDFVAKTITVDVLPAGTVATDVIWHKGAYGKEFAGLHKIITNTGTIFGIDAAQYSLFRGNTYDAGAAPLSMAKVEEAITKAVEKGLDNDVMVLVNPFTWTDLLTDQAAKRMFDSSYSTAKMSNGAKEIEFYGQNGLIKIVPSIYCKQGYAYVLSTEDMIRIGSSDVTFKRPGKEGEFFLDLPEMTAYELRLFCDQALFVSTPAKNVLISNIVS